MGTGPLYSVIYDELRNQIQSGALPIGEQLPTESELAKQFNVSRITAKKALELLTIEGMITRQRGKGSFVVRTSPSGENALAQQHSTTTAISPNSTLIGLVLPEVGESYGLQLLSSIERAANDSGVFVTICRSYGEQESEETAIQRLVHLGVRGLLVFPVNGENYNPEILRLHLNNFPLVLVDKHLPGVPVSAVTTDNKQAAYDLTRHLLDLGHQNIAFFSPPTKDTVTLEDRWEGFSLALQEVGVPHAQHWSVQNFPSDLPGVCDSGYNQDHMDTITAFLADNPEVTAVFATEFQVASHVLIAARNMGKRVPEDLSIACFDAPLTNYFGWQFTHVQQDELSMGRTAVSLLVDEIFKSKRAQSELIQIPANLVIGDSTARPTSHR